MMLTRARHIRRVRRIRAQNLINASTVKVPTGDDCEGVSSGRPASVDVSDTGT
jgi:hypothetical protein